MDESPATRASLLARIRDPRDSDAWRQFVQVYAAVVYGFARKRGLQDADAADMVQEVFRAVARNAARLEYDPKRGTFRGWLYTITRNKIFNFLNGQKRQVHGSGDTGAHELLREHPENDDPAWDLEYERRAFAWAAEQVRDEFQHATWQAFWQTAVEGKNAGEVGQELGLSPGAVYVAKSRVLARLRVTVQRLQQESDSP